LLVAVAVVKQTAALLLAVAVVLVDTEIAMELQEVTLPLNRLLALFLPQITL
jgi:hypothetical protein